MISHSNDIVQTEKIGRKTGQKRPKSGNMLPEY